MLLYVLLVSIAASVMGPGPQLSDRKLTIGQVAVRVNCHLARALPFKDPKAEENPVVMLTMPQKRKMYSLEFISF